MKVSKPAQISQILKGLITKLQPLPVAACKQSFWNRDPVGDTLSVPSEFLKEPYTKHQRPPSCRPMSWHRDAVGDYYQQPWKFCKGILLGSNTITAVFPQQICQPRVIVRHSHLCFRDPEGASYSVPALPAIVSDQSHPSRYQTGDMPICDFRGRYRGQSWLLNLKYPSFMPFQLWPGPFLPTQSPIQ